MFPCPSDSTSDSGSSFCMPKKIEEIKNCGKGEYYSSNRKICIPCPSGKKSNEDHSSCETCPAGTYSSSGSDKCIPCPKGTVSGKGSSICYPCPEERKPNKEGSYCEKCPAGTFSNSGFDKCLTCPKGTYSKEGFSSCPPCGEGYKSNENNTGCDICPAGTYSGSRSSKCNPCPKGTYCNIQGCSSCAPCPEGTYADEEGSSHCKFCQRGTYSLTRAKKCLKCPEGKTSSDYGKSFCDDVEDDGIYNFKKLQEFGEKMTYDIFGQNIEYTNEYIAYIETGIYNVKVTIFQNLQMELKSKIKYKIVNNKIEDIKYYDEFAEKIKTLYEKVKEANKGKYNMLTFNQILNKIGQTVNEGEMYVNYYLPENILEIIIIRKSHTEYVEHKFGIKYEITFKDIGYVTELVRDTASNVAKSEAPDLLPYIMEHSIEYLKQIFSLGALVTVLDLVIKIIIYVIFSLIFQTQPPPL